MVYYSNTKEVIPCIMVLNIVYNTMFRGSRMLKFKRNIAYILVIIMLFGRLTVFADSGNIDIGNGTVEEDVKQDSIDSESDVVEEDIEDDEVPEDEIKAEDDSVQDEDLELIELEESILIEENSLSHGLVTLERVYLDSQNGDNGNDGSSPEMAVRTFNRAVELIGLDREGTIVLTSGITIQSDENWNENGLTKTIVLDDEYQFNNDNGVIDINDSRLTMNNIVLDGTNASVVVAEGEFYNSGKIIKVEGSDKISSGLILNNTKIQNFSTNPYADIYNYNDFAHIIYVNNANLEMNYSVIENNFGRVNSAISALESIVSINNSTINNNGFRAYGDDESFSEEAIIQLNNSRISMIDATVENNRGKNGVINLWNPHFDSQSETQVSNISKSTISANEGYGNAGVFANGNVEVNLNDTDIIGNRINWEVRNSYGGNSAAGLSITNSAKVIMDGGSISRNENVIDGYGEMYYFHKYVGGVFIGNKESYNQLENDNKPATFILNSGSVSENRGSHTGGILLSDSNLRQSVRTLATDVNPIQGVAQSVETRNIMTAPTLAKFVMNDGILADNIGTGYDYKFTANNTEYKIPSTGGGMYIDRAIVKLYGGEITGNRAEGEYGGYEDLTEEEGFPKSLLFPRGNGIYLANTGMTIDLDTGVIEQQFGGNGLYLSGSPKINRNNDVFLENHIMGGLSNEILYSIIQIEDEYKCSSKENQIQLTVPINWQIIDTRMDSKYYEVSRPIIEPEENVEKMGTLLVDYSAAGGAEAAKRAQDNKCFAASEHMSAENGYDPAEYPEYGNGFNIFQSKFDGKESFLTFGSGVLESPVDPEPIEPIEPVDPVEPGKPINPIWPLWPDEEKPQLNLESHEAYMIGYPEGVFLPNGNITRAEAVTIFFRMLTEESRNAFWSTTNQFNDVKNGDWYNNALSTMANANIIEADVNGDYRPDEDITRADFAILLSKFFQVSETTSHKLSDIEGHYAESEIAKVAAKGWIIGYPDGSFRPNESITRAETAKLVNRILERTPHREKLKENMIKFSDVLKDEWYYIEVCEATNSHEYARVNKSLLEEWTKLLPIRDWTAIEKE